MFVKVIVIIALTALCATASEAAVWNGFAASWSLNRSSNFYPLPKTFRAAENEGWTKIKGVSKPRDVAAVGYHGDPTLILLFYRNLAIGVQLSFLVSEVNRNQPVNWDEFDFIRVQNLDGKLFYTSTVYFYESERKNTRRIWLEEKNRVHEIPTKTSEVLSETQWLLKSCVPTMGTHFYEWNPATNCANLMPWGLLSMGSDVTGLIFQAPGSPSTLGVREWWEKIPDGGLLRAISDPPQCLLDGLSEFGAMSMHLWFVDKPQNIGCN